MCSHATVTDSDLLSLIGTYDWDLYFYLLGCSTHQNLMSCSRILNSIKGFKLNQLQWSNITLPFIDSKIDSLVDTNEFLEFVDTLDDRE